MSIAVKICRTARRVRAFFGNTRGNVAMILGISFVPIAMAAGAGLDLTRAMIAKSNLTEAVDSAALAVARTKSKNANMTQSDMDLVKTQYFNANYKTDQTAYGAPTVDPVTTATQSVTVHASVNVPTTLMRIATTLGVAKWPYVTVQASSTVVWGQTKLWVSLVLDNTGSMCQSDSNPNAGSPCPSPATDSKIVALQTASHQLLTILQNASANVGDVKVAIVPFSKTVNVGTGRAGQPWISWTDWEAAPPGGVPATSVGPGSSCPWSTFSDGFRCTTSSTNGASNTNSIPLSGLICPSVHSTSSSTGLGGHYYNGCYNSVATRTTTTTVTQTTETTTKQSCSQKGTGTITCPNKSGYPSTASPTSNSNTAITNGYTGDSVTVTHPNTSNTVDGTKSCDTKSPKTCTWTRTITDDAVTATATATGTSPWNHSWIVNDHSSWGGCIMDRAQNYDTDVTSPTTDGTNFPAENATVCVPSQLGALDDTWDSLNGQIDAMTANGSTNQTIGLDWGWAVMTPAMSTSAPLLVPALPANTSRFIILVSDGLNTQDRFSGDGANQDSTTDTRMGLACTNAKNAGITIYTIFVDLNGAQGNSTVLQNCATDAAKYFDLTSSGAIITTLNTIGQQITNLRVSQ